MEVEQVAADLRFVRGTVEAQRLRPVPRAIPAIWAIYVLVGYTLIDIDREGAQWFFAIGGFAGGIACWAIGRRFAAKTGVREVDNNRNALKGFASIALLFLTVAGLGVAIPSLRGMAGSQVLVALFGILYFQAGLWGPPMLRYLAWGGPLVIVGAIVVAFIPHFGWTLLGVLIASLIALPVFRPGPAPSRAAHV